ncbi:pH-sensitive adenylate cyclase [Nocardioides dokdonensis FR1436]|uniref:pH-sensitive adenylate cyclase n=1 Tax=Nocardioides dokdonensis FR1436 TaxID=1300347 RepID=A0A1A9GJG7_9ACTN|nr:adenylate/guanylate cyclase domain-containing protein [Nocardioides dokdonensis]ANH37820.1 pH-sensitive adenylate cyclase [Nocardioides dokdonensis FR1436]
MAGPAGPTASGAGDRAGRVEELILGEAPHLNRVQVSEQAGVPLELARELWRLLGFAETTDDVLAFTRADVDALRLSAELTSLGVLSDDSQAALVRTLGRSFARLAEWQTTLLARVATAHLVPGSDEDPVEALAELTAEVLPRVEQLQAYTWKRHLATASSRLLDVSGGSTEPGEPGEAVLPQAVCFVDIVGFTSRSKSLREAELVAWIEAFEDASSSIVLDHGGRIIKNIGDEVLLLADDPVVAAEIALEMTRRGSDPDDAFPEVRAGIAYGAVVLRLGDVLGATVNVAARLTSLARPGTVLVDEGAHAHLLALDEASEQAAYTFRRPPRASVKGYSRLQPWVLRRA